MGDGDGDSEGDAARVGERAGVGDSSVVGKSEASGVVAGRGGGEVGTFGFAAHAARSEATRSATIRADELDGEQRVRADMTRCYACRP